MRSASLLVLTLSLGLGACGPVTTYTPRAGTCPARPPTCKFDVLMSRPDKDFQVIGVIELESFHAPNVPNNPADFRKVVHDAVCKAGGDAVYPGINGHGRYVLATVVKWADAATHDPVCPKASPEAGVGDAGAGKDAGPKDAGPKDAAPAAADAAVSPARDAAPTLDGGVSDAGPHALVPHTLTIQVVSV